MSEHVPTLTKLDDFRKSFFPNHRDNEFFEKTKDDLIFVLSRLEMIRDKIMAHPADKNIFIDINRYVRHMEEVLTGKSNGF